MFVNVSPAAYNLETLSSLQFASRCRAELGKAHKNEVRRGGAGCREWRG